MNRNTRMVIVLVVALLAATAASYGVYVAVQKMPRPTVEVAQAHAVVAARALPGEDPAVAADRIKSWNLHIFAMRRPPGLLLGSDVVFVEPPAG